MAGKPPKLVAVALANKMARIIWQGASTYVSWQTSIPRSNSRSLTCLSDNG